MRGVDCGGTIKGCKWALARKEFIGFKLDDILSNWKACMLCGRGKEHKVICWSPPPGGLLKFNVERADKEKPVRRVLDWFFAIAKGTFYICFLKVLGLEILMKQKFMLF